MGDNDEKIRKKETTKKEFLAFSAGNAVVWHLAMYRAYAYDSDKSGILRLVSKCRGTGGVLLI